MNFALKILCFCICWTVTVSEEDADTVVEFSSHESNKPIENAKNASTLILQEIENHVSHELRQEHLHSVTGNDKVQFGKSGSISTLSGKGELANLNTAVAEGAEAQNSSTNTSADAKSKVKVECAPRIIPENEVPTVILANSSVLLKAVTPSATNTSSDECVVVLFYSPQCVFSARMAPHYNALPRVFPDITFYAVDATEQGNLHVRYGLVYVPNVMLFHNSKPFARFNETLLNLDQLVKFIHKLTGLQHNGTLNVTSADMNGPVPSTLTKKVDYLLILAWAFTLSCMCFGFAKSSFCQRIVEFLKNTWQEAAAAQHEHED